jgi:hypothetical protein
MVDPTLSVYELYQNAKAIAFPSDAFLLGSDCKRQLDELASDCARERHCSEYATLFAGSEVHFSVLDLGGFFRMVNLNREEMLRFVIIVGSALNDVAPKTPEGSEARFYLERMNELGLEEFLEEDARSAAQ